MFAFAAAIVLGAFTLASCENDSDDINANHTFTLSCKFESNLESVRNNPDFQKECASTIKSLESDFRNMGMSMTDNQAALVWSQFRDDREVSETAQGKVDYLAQKYKDRTLSLTIIFKRDGADWRSQKWTTNYKDNF